MTNHAINNVSPELQYAGAAFFFLYGAIRNPIGRNVELALCLFAVTSLASVIAATAYNDFRDEPIGIINNVCSSLMHLDFGYLSSTIFRNLFDARQNRLNKALHFATFCMCAASVALYHHALHLDFAGNITPGSILNDTITEAASSVRNALVVTQNTVAKFIERFPINPTPSVQNPTIQSTKQPEL